MCFCFSYCLLFLNFMFYSDSKPKQWVAYSGEEIFEMVGKSKHNEILCCRAMAALGSLLLPHDKIRATAGFITKRRNAV